MIDRFFAGLRSFDENFQLFFYALLSRKLFEGLGTQTLLPRLITVGAPAVDHPRGCA